LLKAFDGPSRLSGRPRMGSHAEVTVFLGCLVVSLVLTAVVRWHALRAGVLDVPNARSSHTQPTPRGGGLAIVASVCLAVAYLWGIDGTVGAELGIAVLGGGGLVAAVGYLDDRMGLSAAVRFGAHLLAAIMAMSLLGVRELAAAALPALPDPLAAVILVIATAWALNLFNFMDGVDGIAAAEAAFVAGAAACLAGWVSVESDAGLRVLLLGVAAACLGFLVWNWAPAKIFMGDVGSGFLGYVLAVMAMASLLTGALSVWTWLILTSLFVADATVTLLRRIVRGERWYAAHRSHAYQWLARRWSSHSRVTLALSVINLAVVLPLAWWSVENPADASMLAVGVLVAAIITVLACGAGRPERAQ